MPRPAHVVMVVAAAAPLAALGWMLANGSASSPPPATYVEIVAPQPAGKSYENKSATQDPDECTTGCSLKKHPIPPFGRGDYERAIHDYARQPATAASQGLETLLFYPYRTLFYMDKHGTGALSPEHLAYLRRQLSRDHALVSIRMIDDSDAVRVAYGPERVPIGYKQHLKPVEHDLQPLEFNGTVMRTGVDYLWARY